jgi:RNA polymerase sigma factor (sigma-70 family)
MNEPRPDFTLLQAFARDGNQQAFADVVRRHLDLVYATALRKLSEPDAAQEVAQNVFAALARKAWQFAPDDSLPAWLYKTTLLEAKSWLRGELRRRRREQTAGELGTTMKTPDEQPALRTLVPLLDEALLSLRESDRTALLLRFYDSQSLRDVGVSLGTSEEAARKRVQSALERLAHFFQRRGFKTATVASTTAMLQQTAISASSAMAGAVVNAALQAAPPALVGLSALLARFASLTKVQTAAVCLAIAAGPVAWQVSEQREAQAALAHAKTQLAAAQNEFNVVQTEIERLNESTMQLDDSLASARDAAARSAETAQKFAAWKQRTRAQLLAADYQWPEDSPFVRIPKQLLPQLQVHQPITQPGVIIPEARELLGLTPTEREQAEAALHNHFSAMDFLMESNRYETNRAKFANLPKDTLARQVWGLPALGDEAKQHAEELQATLRTVLGKERWQIVERLLQSSGTDTLRRILSLDAGERGQELAVWIQEREGKLVAGYSWGEPSGTFSQSGLALSLFAPDKEFPIPGASVEDYLNVRQLSAALTHPAMTWLQQQAGTRLGKKGDQ